MKRLARSLLVAAALAALAPAAYAQGFSTSAVSPTPVPPSGLIEGRFPAGQSDATYYFAVDLKAGRLATQMGLKGGSQYKAIDFVLLDGGGRRIDGYHVTAGADENAETTRIFPIDASSRYIVKLITKGPEATSFRVALGGTALPNRPVEAAAVPSPSFLAPTPVGPDGTVTGRFPGGQSYTHYYYAVDLKAGTLLTQVSISGRAGALKWVQLALLDDQGRPDRSYHLSRTDANADATKSFPIDRSGRYVLRVKLEGGETASFKVELGGDALATR